VYALAERADTLPVFNLYPHVYSVVFTIIIDGSKETTLKKAAKVKSVKKPTNLKTD